MYILNQQYICYLHFCAPFLRNISGKWELFFLFTLCLIVGFFSPCARLHAKIEWSSLTQRHHAHENKRNLHKLILLLVLLVYETTTMSKYIIYIKYIKWNLCRCVRIQNKFGNEAHWWRKRVCLQRGNVVLLIIILVGFF